MKTFKKSKAKNVKKAIKIINLNELLQIRGGQGTPDDNEID